MNWYLLINALIILESGGDWSAVGDNGNAHGGLQIWQCVVTDVNRIKGSEFTLKEMHDESKARYVCFAYLMYYGKRYERITGKEPTSEVLARIWNGGPNGFKKPCTERYAKRFRELQ